MADGSLIFDTKIDPEGFEKGGTSLKSQAAKLAAEYKRQGMSSSEAFKKAWSEIERTSKTSSEKTKSNWGKMSNGLESQASGIGSVFKKLGVAAIAAFSVTAIVNFGKKAVEMASNLTEVQNVVDTAFKDMSYKIEDFSKTSIEKFGISELSAKKTASTYMAMARGIGLVADQGSDMSVTLTGLTADMSSFYNCTQEVADTALKSIFTGETESLKQFGIVMTQTNLQQFAYSKGIRTTIDDMTQAQQTQLRYAYVMEQTKLAQGDFAKTSGSWANQTRVLSQRWGELLTILGNGLVQVLTPVVKWLNTALSYVISFASAVGKSVSNIFGITLGAQKSASSNTGNLKNETDKQTAIVSSGADNQKKALQKSLDAQEKALEKSYKEQEKALNKSLDAETKAFEKASDEKLKIIDNEYTEKLKLIDEDKYNKIKALDDEISQLNGLSEAEDKAAQEKADADKLSELQAQVNNAETAEEKQKAEKELQDFQSELRQKQLKAERDVQIKSLESQKDCVEDEAKAKSDALKLEYDGKKEALKEQLDLEKEALQEKQELIKENFQEEKQLALDNIREINSAKLEALQNSQAQAQAEDFSGKLGLEQYNVESSPVKENDNGMGAVVENGIKSAVDNVKSYIEPLIPIGSFVADMFADICTIISDFWNKYGEPISTAVSNAVNSAFDVLKTGWENFGKPVFDGIMNGLSVIWEALKPLIEEVMSFIGELVICVSDFYDKCIAPKVKWFAEYVYPIIAKIVNVIVGYVSNSIANLIEVIGGIVKILKGIIEFITGVFTGDWDKAWEGIKNIFGGIWDALVSIVKTPVNAIVDIINKLTGYIGDAINGVIEGINSLSFDLPEWMTGGKSVTFGLNLSKLSIPKIPKLATGAVIPPRSEFLAVLGDQRNGTNIETPLATMIEAFKCAIAEMGGLGTSITQINNSPEALNDYENYKNMQKLLQLIAKGAV